MTPTAKPPGKELLPDLGIIKLDGCSQKEKHLGWSCFYIERSGDQKLLKFPVTTINLGKGPLEIRAQRSGITANDWQAVQRIYLTGGKHWDVPAPGVKFYYAGDGHNHWHIRDFDSYAIDGQIQHSEKHGFCFEDNMQWASRGKVVYLHEDSCGQGQPDATQIVHGLSVGSGDTYPSRLPNQAIDVTGLPDGEYTVKIKADWQNFWKEVNENNNTASARIKIKGDQVAVLSTSGGF
jgi:hypothetical protein